MKTIGVLGGMGPDATVDFMSRVIDACRRHPASVQVPMLVDHNPQVPDRQNALIGDGDSPGPALAAMARRLQTAGAGLLVMPCNTAHAFAESITAAVDIPFLSIIDVTMSACAGHTAIGVLATRGCIASRIFQDALERAGIGAVVPPDEDLVACNALVRRVQHGDTGAGVREEMRELAQGLASQGATAVIAGCTEIPLVLDDDALDVRLLNATQLLADAAVAAAVGAPFDAPFDTIRGRAAPGP